MRSLSYFGSMMFIFTSSQIYAADRFQIINAHIADVPGQLYPTVGHAKIGDSQKGVVYDCSFGISYNQATHQVGNGAARCLSVDYALAAPSSGQWTFSNPASYPSGDAVNPLSGYVAVDQASGRVMACFYVSVAPSLSIQWACVQTTVPM